jgi:hypothetical protein
MTDRATVRLVLGQPRLLFGVLAAMNIGFALLLLIPTGGWPWERYLLLAVDLFIGLWATRKAMRVVKIGPEGVKVVNTFTTHRVRWEEIERFGTRPGSKTGLAVEPIMELKDGGEIVLSALAPSYDPKVGAIDMSGALANLNRRLRAHSRDSR